MKNVLNYQTSEYDCGPTSLTNAVRFLFERDEIPPELLKTVFLYTLDAYDEHGGHGRHGTSRYAMKFLAEWFNQYGRSTHFPIRARFIENEQVQITQNSDISQCLQQGGAVVLHCYLCGDPHYVLLTRMMGDAVGLFDPYDMSDEEFAREGMPGDGVQKVDDRPREMNRVVPISTLASVGMRHYCMGAVCTREAMLIHNEAARARLKESIEYII